MKHLLFILLFPILVFSQVTISQPKRSVISLDKVKVVYRGIDNPITVAVPNVKEFWVSGPGVSKTDELGKYIIRPGSGTELKIVITIKLQDDSIVTEEQVYQIISLPNLITTINKQFSTQGYLEFSLEELKDAKVGIKLIDFLFPQFPIVYSFIININGIKVYENVGNIFTDKAYDVLKKEKKNDLVIISDVRWFFSGVSQLNKPSSPVTIKIIK